MIDRVISAVDIAERHTKQGFPAFLILDADRRRCHLALSAAAIAESGTWALDGSSSISVWIQAHLRMSKPAANTLLSEGRFLRRFTTVADAVLSGRVFAAQLTVIRQAVPPLLADIFQEHQGAVVDAVAELNVVDTGIVCADWRAKAEAIVDIPPPDLFRDRSWKSSKLDDGSMVGRFAFDPVGGGELDRAIEHARCWDGDEIDQRTAAQTSADAVAAIAAFYNANHDREITPRHRNHADVNFDTHTALHPDCDAATCPGHTSSDPAKLFEAAFGSGACVITADGVLLPEWAGDAYLCDCVMHRVIRSASAVLDYGVAERTAPRDLFRAVAARDRGCRFPGCDRKVGSTQAHHIVYWENLGPTRIENLLLLCWYHHHLIHRQHWRITLHANADADFTTPDGRTFSSKTALQTQHPNARGRLTPSGPQAPNFTPRTTPDATRRCTSAGGISASRRHS